MNAGEYWFLVGNDGRLFDGSLRDAICENKKDAKYWAAQFNKSKKAWPEEYPQAPYKAVKMSVELVPAETVSAGDKHE